MPTHALRTQLRFFVSAALILSLALTLASCNTSNHVCNISSLCTCASNAVGACPVNPNDYLYASASPGQILTFSIDSKTGVLTGPIGDATGPQSAGVAAVNGEFLYISDPAHGQIEGFSINSATGFLALLPGSPFSTGNPSAPHGLGYAAVASGLVLYAADGAAVDAFTVTGGVSGVPKVITGSPFASGTNTNLAVDPMSRFVYTSVDDAPGGIFAFSIGSTGALTEVPGSPFTIPGQTVANSQPAGIVDIGSYVYVALSGSNQIAAFSIDNSGALMPVAGSPFAAGSTPTTIAVWDTFLYAINSGDGTISGYKVNLSTGVLTPLAGSPFAVSGTALTVDIRSGYLYVTSANGIDAFGIDSTTGNLTALSGFPFPVSGVVGLTVVSE
jgi:6-phosphogluconolactonase